jgi:replicative DNA helicase
MADVYQKQQRQPVSSSAARGDEGRIPPQAVDVEMSVLGAMLIEKEAIARALDLLNEDAFYKEAHRFIFQGMIALFDRSEPVDIVTLTEELKRRGVLEKVGGSYYLTELTERITSAANIEYHAKIVLEKALMRQLIASSNEISGRAYENTEDAFDLLDEAEQKIFKISEQHLKRSFVSMNQALHQTMEMLENIHGKHSGITGVPTGFTALDNITGGFQKSDLIVVAGRPAMGKTALVLSAARNASIDYDKPVAFFSLEMSAQQLVLRLICAEARVDQHKVRTGRLPEDQWQYLSTRIGKLAKAKLFIDDSPSLGILELRAKSRRLKAEHDVQMIIVDYLQLMQGPKGLDSREREISTISRSLKALAKELDVPVLALSQLNRAVEARSDKRPQLADLRESGAIEQDADVVMFVHRPEAYGIREEGGESTEGVAEIIVGKQRNGPIDTARMSFIKSYARFENLALKQFTGFEPAEASDKDTPAPF